MISLVNHKIHYNDICLCSLKSFEEDESDVNNHYFILTKQDDTTEVIYKSELTPYEYATLEAYHNQYLSRIASFESDLQIAKNAKIGELSDACTVNIFKGFSSDAFETDVYKIYDFEDRDQANLVAMMAFTTTFMGEVLPYWWKAQGELESYPWTTSQILKLCKDAYIAKIQKMKAYHDLRLAVVEATSFEAVQAVEWVDL